MLRDERIFATEPKFVVCERALLQNFHFSGARFGSAVPCPGGIGAKPHCCIGSKTMAVFILADQAIIECAKLKTIGARERQLRSECGAVATDIGTGGFKWQAGIEG